MAENQLQLQLVTPSGTLFDERVDEVTVMTQDGEITVLPFHSPLVSTLKPGECVVRTNGQERALAIAGGFLEISDNVLRILADNAALPDDIDVAKAEKRAEELAKELEEQEQIDMTTYNTLLHSLQQEQARLRVAKKWRK